MLKLNSRNAEHSDVDEKLFKAIEPLSLVVNTLFDVGAHEGRFVKSAQKYFNPKRIYAFEPYNDSYNKLVEECNHSNIHCVNVGLYDIVGQKEFRINAFNETNSLLDSVITQSGIDDYTRTVRVDSINLTTLDAFCDENQIKAIDLLKIDVQGVGFNVLKGGQHLLSEGAINCIVCEVEFIEIYKGEVLYHDIARYLYEYGYVLYTLHNIHYDINGRSSWADAIFIKN